MYDYVLLTISITPECDCYQENQVTPKMRSVPTDLAKNYSILLVSRAIPSKNHYHFQKGLRFYLDFRHEYQFIFNDNDSLPHFVRKLHEKHQTLYQQKQASHAIGLFYELLTCVSSGPANPPKVQMVSRISARTSASLSTTIA